MQTNKQKQNNHNVQNITFYDTNTLHTISKTYKITRMSSQMCHYIKLNRPFQNTQECDDGTELLSKSGISWTGT